MEAAFGTSFADVRVHIGHEAATIGALAFTHGTDLYFAPGQYNPQTQPGQKLLGHELAHVVQQRAGRVRNPVGAGVAVVQDPALEDEAERLGMRAASMPHPIQAKLAETPTEVRRPASAPILPVPAQAVQPRRPDAVRPSAILPGPVAGRSLVQARSVAASGHVPVQVAPPARVGENTYRIVAGAGGQAIGW